MKKVLAVETSCDDTCTALVREDGFVEASFSQDQNKIHAPFGGVVPERASRNHSRHLLPLIDKILKLVSIDDISVFVATGRPGLQGSLLVGLVTLETLAVLYKKPFIKVDHIEGHILSPFLYDFSNSSLGWKFPYIALVVSGGNTQLFLAEKFSQYVLLGETLDDAAGEAFDKFARLAGLPYPGGVFVDQTAAKGDTCKYDFPRALSRKGNLNFSFSGLKTSARLLIQKMENKESELAHLSASFQEAVVDQILFKLNECRKMHPQYKRFAIVGGVSANSRLRQKCMEWGQFHSLNVVFPPLKYCTDNAAMIGYTGIHHYLKNKKHSSKV